MQATLTVPVTFTPSAIEEIKRLMNEEGFDSSTKLRVGVKGGGCSGLTYVLGFDQPGDNDQEYQVEGVPFLLDKSHELYLYGMEVDWENGLNARGFVFNNPNASKTCGCGTSFSV